MTEEEAKYAEWRRRTGESGLRLLGIRKGPLGYDIRTFRVYGHEVEFQTPYDWRWEMFWPQYDAACQPM